MTKAPLPKPSSTILIVRDGEATPSLEVLMVGRNRQIDFASGALVFPGGKLIDEDKDPAWANHVVGDFSDEERAIRLSALRETFEETGVLFAIEAAATHDAPYIDDERLAPLQPLRAEIDANREGFLAAVRDAGLKLCLDRLVPYAHWITPEFMPKRFDTFFYIVTAPDAQTPEFDGRETTEAFYICPREALKREKEGTATIIFPTRVNVEMLAESDTAEGALQASQERNIVSVLPTIKKRGDDNVLCIPKEAGYATYEEKMMIPG